MLEGRFFIKATNAYILNYIQINLGGTPPHHICLGKNVIGTFARNNLERAMQKNASLQVGDLHQVLFGSFTE